MKHYITSITLLLAFCFSTQIEAQRNPMLQQANKEFDLHAYNLAIKSYRKVIEKDPDNAIAYTGVADCYRLLGRMDESANWYKKAIQLEDVDPSALFHYGKTLMALGEYEQALEWFLVYAEGQPIYGSHYAESCEFAMSLRGMPALYRVKKEFANTIDSDFGPAFLDGNIVFSSARTDLVRQMEKDHAGWNGAAKNQLFISGIDANGYLTKPSFLRNDLQNVYNEGPVSYSADGAWVAFAKNNFINGTRQIPGAGLEGSIFIAPAKPDGTWDEAMPFPHNGSGYSSVYPHLSADGQKLYFASNRPDGYGGFDLYVSYRIGATWTSPENLGPVVNTGGNEISPYMDNEVLYFASDWHHGLGGMDLFRAVREEGLWSKVFHLGNTVNSSFDDYSLIFNGAKNTGYFVSNRKGGSGNEDLYHISKLSEDATVVVTAQGSGKPIRGASLDFTNCGSNVFPTDEFGKYRFQVFDGLVCDVVVSMTGYKSSVLKIAATDASNNVYTVSLQPSSSTAPTEVITATNDNPVKSESLSGLLFDSRTNRPVADVVVTAQTQDNTANLRAISASNGSYQLDLQPNTSYLIRYSKMGYLDTHQKIETGAIVANDVLGVLMLNASTTNLESKPEVVTSVPPKNNTGGSTTNNTNTSTTETVADGEPFTSPTSTTTGTTTETTNTETISEVIAQQGFSVQVAALGLQEKVANSKYMSLSGIGNLYSRPEKGMKKVRVGIYRSRAEATEARKSIVAKGFSSAFIVSENVSDPTEINVFDAATTLEAAPIPVQEKTPDVVKEREPKSTDIVDIELPVIRTEVPKAASFMVRLATYTRPEFFDGSEVKALGRIEERLKGNMTIMLIGGFADLQEARNATIRAVDMGYSGAHVVMEENGKLIKI